MGDEVKGSLDELQITCNEVKGSLDELQQRLMQLCGEFNKVPGVGCQTCVFCTIGLDARNGLIEAKMGKIIDWFHFKCSANSCPDCIDDRPGSLECGVCSEADTEIQPCRFYRPVPKDVAEKRWAALLDFHLFYQEWCRVNRL